MTEARRCTVCDAPVPAGSRGETCGFSCRARLRESRKTREWRTKRDYPEEVVALAKRLYLDEGMTIAEVQAELPPGHKAQRIIARFIPERRPAAPRDQRGERNASWKGRGIGYQAAHVRASSANGPASAHLCTDCGSRAHEWSYNHDDPHELRDARGLAYSPDPSHYSPRCRSCHRSLDAKRRKEVMPNDS